MWYSKTQLLYGEVENRLLLRLEVLTSNFIVQPISVEPVDFLAERLGLPAEFDFISRRTLDLQEIFGKEKRISKCFPDLFRTTQLLMNQLNYYLQREQLSTESFDPVVARDRAYYSFNLYLHYHRYLQQLTYFIATNFVPVPKNFWECDSEPVIPIGTLTQLEKEEHLIPKKVALTHVLGFDSLYSVTKQGTGRVYQIFNYLLGGINRTIAGNFRILDPNSNENPLKFTSHRYINYWVDILKNRKPIR